MNTHLMDEVTRRVVSRWLVAQTEALIPTKTRLAVELDMHMAFENDPKWSAVWSGGVVSSLVRSLPADDPWRHLSAYVKPLEPLVGYAGVPHPGPGAKTTQGDFGSLRDMLDIRIPELSDAQSDLGLAAVFDPISDDAAAVIAYGAESWSKAALVLENAGERMFEVASDAIRYAAARRRVYCGLDDQYFAQVCFAWQWRADRSVEGDDWDVEEVEAEVAEGAVDSGAYADLCLDPQLHPKLGRSDDQTF